MWPGPYGEFLSRKYLISSCEQSLKRLQVDYVDLFYAHRPDPNTPTDETMDALDQIVRSGKAIYCGLSNHGPEEIRDKQTYAISHHTARPIISQSRYSMLDRHVEAGELQACREFGMGFMAFTPLAQGMLSDKYLTQERPAESRLDLSRDICAERLGNREQLDKVLRLNEIARRRGQTLAQLAIVWLLHRPEVTSVLIGASRPRQIEENVAALDHSDFSADEMREIDTILQG
jgi:L-glyceraldehyde 3-phosphate reductase